MCRACWTDSVALIEADELLEAEAREARDGEDDEPKADPGYHLVPADYDADGWS